MGRARITLADEDVRPSPGAKRTEGSQAPPERALHKVMGGQLRRLRQELGGERGDYRGHRGGHQVKGPCGGP